MHSLSSGDCYTACGAVTYGDSGRSEWAAGTVGFVLAAGEGRRLLPATLTAPKALVPVMGVPLLEMALGRLAAVGLPQLFVNACCHAEQVSAAAREIGERLGVPVVVSRESALLGTGGGLRHALRHEAEVRQVLVTNADVVLDVDLRAVLAAFVEWDADALLVLVPRRGPLTVGCGADGLIRDFRMAPGTGEFTFSGVHLFKADLLHYLPATPCCSIVEAYEQALLAGRRVLGMSSGDAYWSDLGTTERYLDTHRELAVRPPRHIPALRKACHDQGRRRQALIDQGVTITGATGIGQRVHVARGSRLHDVVLWDDVSVAVPSILATGILVAENMGPARPCSTPPQPDPRILATLGVNADAYELEPFPKQGSGRIYARLRAGDQSWVWCRYDSSRTENATFAAVAGSLARLGLRVPRVLIHLPARGELLLRDLGNRTLIGEDDPAVVPRVLADALDQLALLHVRGRAVLHRDETPMQPPFDAQLYDWERDYFRAHVLARLANRPAAWDAVAEEYGQVRELLATQPLVPLHRDCQSANIIIAEGRAHFLDFQGLRLGVGAYDVASLIDDPYRCYPPELQGRMIAHYGRAVEALGGESPSSAVLQAAGIQRLLQALGAFSKLWLTDGLSWYASFLGPGLRMLARVAAQDGRFPSLAALADTVRSFTEGLETPADG